MCICCCICNCCNSYSSKCVELSILILTWLIFICSLSGFLCIKWSHLTTACSILLIILIAFSTYLVIGSLCINLFRYKGIINKDKNSFSTYLSMIGLIITLIIFILSLIAESLIQTNFKDIDYPCKDISSSNTNLILRILSPVLSTYDEKVQFCRNKNVNYNAKICSNLEYTMSYLTSTIIEFCSLILCFFWYNDFRRIREKVDGELPIYDNAYITRGKYSNEMNYNEGDPADPSDRYMNPSPSDLVQSQVVLVKNQKKNNSTFRKSQPLKMNNKKEEKSTSFIKNLRREMQEAIESIDEEDSNENKENKEINENKEENKDKNEKNIENINEELYSNKESNNDDNNKNNKIDDIKKNDTNDGYIENLDDKIVVF